MASSSSGKRGQPPSRATLLRHVRELRGQLDKSEQARAEAEQVLEAIRTGAVDAVVVGGAGGEQVYTLHGAERPYRALIETVNAGAVTLDLDGTILYANRQTAAMAAVPLEQLIGAPLDRFLLPDDVPAFLTLLQESPRQGGAREVRLRREGQAPLPVQLATRFLETPELQAVCIVLTDLSEHRRAEEALRRAQAELERRVEERTAELAAQQQLLEAILEQAAEGIVVRDARGRVILANAEVRRWAGAKPEGTPLELAPGVWGETFDATGKRLPVEQWPISRALRGEPGTRVEFHRVAADGRRRVILNSAAALRDAAGAIIGAVAVNTDITEHKQVEEQLRRALADNEALLREVHHRVKNNLQVLCDLLYLQMETMEDREKRGVLQDTYGRIYAIARLHEQLYQSIERGRVRLEDYLGRLVRGLEQVYPCAPVRLETGDGELYLDLDRAIHTGLMVTELVTNAVKHAYPEGQAGEVGLRVQTVGEQVSLQVWDRGCGLPAALDLERARTLGLRIVHILARRLEAAVSVERQGGTRFTITFPVQPTE